MIKIIDLHKSFGEKQVLSGVNLEVKKGETMVIIGQSGSGKSVLLKLIIGILKPDRGKIYVDGTETTGLKEEERLRLNRKFGMVFQGAALFDSMTVAENVAFGLERHLRLSSKEIREIVRASLEMVGLRGVEKLMPHQLSGGMKKRVGLARAIAYRPEIMLYDEPSTGIDPIRADAINEMINKFKQEMGMTSIVITHDMASAYKVADRIAMLYGGRIIEVGTPEEIRQSLNPIVQQFIRGEAHGPIDNW
ncbi:MAG: ABC transporter ATP-binding protein [Candidatus Aminicenantes bacterium]|nr:ABC transporter ATP-binding protein [Candidatus Aminicenantes bacterium]